SRDFRALSTRLFIPCGSSQLSQDVIRYIKLTKELRELFLDNPKTVELLARNVYMGAVDPPIDQTLKTLYLRRLNSSVHEQHIRDRFSPYGEIESIVYFAMRGVDGAFLTYTSREAAEKAMLEHSSWVVINGQNVKLLWGAHVIPKEAAVHQENQPHHHDTDVSRVLIH
uniref:RRM domain-containing protein n=1 Tax=Brassica oleracea var. oleracea TaxID=109376 RepID=A0A0D3EHX6_BRAOL